MKWGRIIRQNSFHLEKLVFCSSVFCVMVSGDCEEEKECEGGFNGKLSNDEEKSVIRVWMSQTCKRMFLLLQSHF